MATQGGPESLHCIHGNVAVDTAAEVTAFGASSSWCKEQAQEISREHVEIGAAEVQNTSADVVSLTG